MKYIDNKIKAFCKKEEVEFDSWVGNVIGGIAIFGKYYLNYTDIIYDLQTNQIKGTIFRWYDYSILNPYKSVSYEQYCKSRKNKG